MSKTQTVTRSFAGGVVSPEMFGRADLGPYQSGLKKCENFVVKPSGAVTKRPGFEYICKLPLSVSAPVVIDFEKDSDTSFALAFFTNGIWFFKSGVPVVETPKTVSSITASAIKFTAAHGFSVGDYSGKATGTGVTTATSEDDIYKVTAVSTTTIANDTATVEPLWASTGDTTAPTGSYFGRVYKITTTISEADLASMRTSQSELTLTLQVEGSYPKELTYVSDNSWTYASVSFASQIDPPGSENPYLGGSDYATAYGHELTPLAAFVGTTIDDACRYRITAVAESGEESIVSEDAISCVSTGGLRALAGVTAANPAVFSQAANHNLVNGDYVTYWGIPAGAWGTALNGKRLRVFNNAAPGTTQYTAVDPATGLQFDGTGLGAFPGGSMDLIGTRLKLETAGAKVRVVFWSNGAPRYNIYKQDLRSLLYGYVGTVELDTAYKYGPGQIAFYDDNIVPDVTKTPPEEWNPFTTSGDYPTAVANHDQRRVFAGSTNDPQRMWLTPVGFPSSMNQHFPIQDDDSFDFRLAAKKRQKVQHIISLGDMLVLTTSAVWQVGGNGGALSPSNLGAYVQANVGATDVQPAECESTTVFISSGGDRPYEVSYSQDGRGGYQVVDIGVYAPDLFDGYTISSMTYCRGVIPTIWAVRSDGTLLSCTYVPGQDVRAWHTHTTDGTVLSVRAVREGNLDRLYAIVARDVDGTTFRMLERLKDYRLGSQNAAFFADSGTTVSGSSTTVTGLWHLEGETVVALADGVVVRDLVVASGAVTLPEAATTRTVGRPYIADVETLPLSFRTAGGGMGRLKDVSEVDLRVFESYGIWVGNDFDNLREEKGEVSGTYSIPAPLLTEEINVPIDPDWGMDATVCIRSIDPLPLTLQCLALTVAVSG